MYLTSQFNLELSTFNFQLLNKTFLIETNRLRLRELNDNDILPLYEILSDPETMKYYPAPYNLGGAEGWINKSRNSYRENGFGLWAIVLKSDEIFIGQCGITYTDIDGENLPEIGYHLNKNFWNQGFATEAASAVLNYGFKNLKIKKIFIHTWVKNVPSIRIAEKIGMMKIKEYDKHIQKHDMIRRHVVYSMSNE